MKSEILFFIDFGFENISLLACKIKDNRLIDVPLFLQESVKLPSQRTINVFAQIENFETLLKIINDAEKKLKTCINEIIFISKNDAFNVYTSSCCIEFNKQQKILQSHKEKLCTKIIKSFYQQNNENSILLDFIFNSATIDGTIIVKNPYKMSCKKMSINATIIGIKKIFVKNLSVALERYKIHIKHYISSCVCVCYKLSDYFLPKENYLIIDIGCGSAEYCVVQNQCIILLDNINIGGLDMTRDIAEEMKIYIKDADISKKNINNVEIKKSTNENTKFVAKQIENIADARFFEIIESIKRALQEKKINKKMKKIYIYGGVSFYKNAQYIINEIFNTEVECIDVNYIFKNHTIKHIIPDIKNISLISAVDFYLNNLQTYQNAKKGFLFKIPSKISCFLKDLLY